MIIQTMKITDNKKTNQGGFALTALIAIIGAASLLITGSKVAIHVYEKSETDEIAQNFEEQSKHLANNAATMGKGGDEAVRESLRLNEAAKNIRKHGTVAYQQEMMGEAVSLGKSLVISTGVGGAVEGMAKGLGETAKTAKELSGTSGMLLDLNGIDNDLNEVEKNTIGKNKITSEKDQKLHDLIIGSKDNVDDFNLAQARAITDDLINMRKELKKMGDEVSSWIAIREQAIKDLENAEKLRKQNREKARLKALENENIRILVKEAVENKPSKWINVIKRVNGEKKEEKKENIKLDKPLDCEASLKILQRIWKNANVEEDCQGSKKAKLINTSTIPVGGTSYKIIKYILIAPNHYKKKIDCSNGEMMTVKGVSICMRNDQMLHEPGYGQCHAESPGTYIFSSQHASALLKNKILVEIYISHNSHPDGQIIDMDKFDACVPEVTKGPMLLEQVLIEMEKAGVELKDY